MPRRPYRTCLDMDQWRLQERQAALERQMSHLVEKDAVIQPELPARCIPPLFGGGGDIYNKRFVRLSRPPAGMSMLPVRASPLPCLLSARCSTSAVCEGYDC